LLLGLVVGEASLVSTIGGLGGALLAWAVFHFQWIKLPEEVGLELQPHLASRLVRQAAG